MENFFELRDRYIRSKFEKAGLDSAQVDAILYTGGPLQIIAGAGSGKTTVLINRIINLVCFGTAYGSEDVSREPTEEDCKAIQAALAGGPDVPEKTREVIRYNPVPSSQILACTFTNKAANELIERINANVPGGAGTNICAATMHSVCAKFLRSNAVWLGYRDNFSIYDEDDVKRVMNNIYKDLNIDKKKLPVNRALFAISGFKDNLLLPEDVAYHSVMPIYKAYNDYMFRCNAMDFDDLIFNAVRVFRKKPNIADAFKKHFPWIMVDEFQDTSVAQAAFIRCITNPTSTITVVGDDDQSIYSFRGAVIQNFLNFPVTYPSTKKIFLERNYRSTAHILSAANALIKNNTERNDKTLRPVLGNGEKVVVKQYSYGAKEASDIIKNVQDIAAHGTKYSDIAILFRSTKLLAPAFEEQCIASHIPYTMTGSLKFFDRREVKDILAYLRLIVNPDDDEALRRIANVPARKIGASSIDKIANLAKQNHCSMFEIIEQGGQFFTSKSLLSGIAELRSIIHECHDNIPYVSLGELIQEVIDQTRYTEYLESLAAKEDDDKRIDNLNTLITLAENYQAREGANASLAGMLSIMSLDQTTKEDDEDTDKLYMLTVHAAKGLEFKYVFVVGCEDGLFPVHKCDENTGQEVNDPEEERRCMYVAMTRAKEHLQLSYCDTRYIFGRRYYSVPSLFLDELDENSIQRVYSGNDYGYSPRASGDYWF